MSWKRLEPNPEVLLDPAVQAFRAGFKPALFLYEFDTDAQKLIQEGYPALLRDESVLIFQTESELVLFQQRLDDHMPEVEALGLALGHPPIPVNQVREDVTQSIEKKAEVEFYGISFECRLESVQTCLQWMLDQYQDKIPQDYPGTVKVTSYEKFVRMIPTGSGGVTQLREEIEVMFTVDSAKREAAATLEPFDSFTLEEIDTAIAIVLPESEQSAAWRRLILHESMAQVAIGEGISTLKLRDILEKVHEYLTHKAGCPNEQSPEES